MIHLKSFFLAAFLLVAAQSFSQNWLTDFDQAKKEAAQTNDKIILVFQGSDWCAPCMKLEREIWSSPEFQKLSKDKFVFLKADFPRRKKNQLPKAQQEHNAQLFETYNPDGYFPLVVVLDKNGTVLGKMGYEKIAPAQYFKKLSSF